MEMCENATKLFITACVFESICITNNISRQCKNGTEPFEDRSSVSPRIQRARLKDYIVYHLSGGLKYFRSCVSVAFKTLSRHLLS